MELNGFGVYEQQEWEKISKALEKDCETLPNTKLAREKKQWFLTQKKNKNESLMNYDQMKECPSFPRYLRQSLERRRRKMRQGRSYLEKVMSKQYKPKVLVFDCQSSGELSVPECREAHESLSSATVHSDICSCCYGNFQNIDKYMSNPQYSTVLEEPSSSRTQCYYDDKFYDIVPVKDKTNVKAKHEKKLQQKINMQGVLERMDMLCKPSEIRPKLRPVTVNYHTITPNRNWDSHKLNRKEKILAMNKLIKKQKSARRHSDNTSCSIECGNIYAKNVNPGIKFTKLPKSRRMKYANLETLHVNNNKKQPNTSGDKQADVKTEETLKQIKSILISVLSEVKSTSQNQPLGKGKRDVNIQKGLSHSDMVYSNSELLHNFSYGSYGMNPFVANSQMHPNVCYPMNCPLRYSQNYPILIQQPQPRPLCVGCSKPRSKESQNLFTIRDMSPSTNTASESKRTTETENLIKEIYKSMALGLETSIPPKAMDGLTRSPSNKSIASKNAKNTKPKIDKLTTPFLTLENKSVTARVNVSSYEDGKSKKRVADEPPASIIDGNKDDEEEESESEESITESESAESEGIVVLAKGTSKGLFSKMMSSIFKKKKVVKKAKRKRATPVRDEETSDSDDYQTVYSQEIPTTSAKRELHRPAKTTFSHSKRPIPLRKERRDKKYNYFTDEEYRRQWAMKLAERENRRYMERPQRVPSSIRGRQNDYAKNYETLQALMQYRDEFEDGRQRRSRFDEKEPVKKEGWLKRHKLLPKCLPEWKKTIFES